MHVPSKDKTRDEVNTASPAAGAVDAQKGTTKTAAGSQAPALEDVPTPTAAYRTPSAKNKVPAEGKSSNLKQSGSEKDDGDVFVDTPRKDRDDDDEEEGEKSDNVSGKSNATLRINTSFRSGNATATITTTTSSGPAITTSAKNDKAGPATTTTSSGKGDVQN